MVNKVNIVPLTTIYANEWLGIEYESQSVFNNLLKFISGQASLTNLLTSVFIYHHTTRFRCAEQWHLLLNTCTLFRSVLVAAAFD